MYVCITAPFFGQSIKIGLNSFFILYLYFEVYIDHVGLFLLNLCWIHPLYQFEVD